VTISTGQAKLKAYTAGPVQTENGVAYREVQFVMEFRASWDHTIDDRGFNEKDPAASGKLKEVVKGTPPVKPDKPWPLDGSGAAKAAATDAPAILTFRPYARLSFAGFNFA
jgi:hypothetical protein